MSGYEPVSSVVGSDHSANCTRTLANCDNLLKNVTFLNSCPRSKCTTTSANFTKTTAKLVLGSAAGTANT